MNKAQFRNTMREVPQSDGRFEVEVIKGCRMPADFVEGEWFYISGDKMPDNMDFRWRENG